MGVLNLRDSGFDSLRWKRIGVETRLQHLIQKNLRKKIHNCPLEIVHLEKKKRIDELGLKRFRMPERKSGKWAIVSLLK